MTTEITPEFREQLRQFCIELNAWIEAGCPDHKVFHRNDGICWNFAQWIGTKIGEYIIPSSTPITKYFGKTYPFGTQDDFETEQANLTLYQNPARLAWIKEHMK